MIHLNRLTVSISLAAFSLAAVFVLVKKIFSLYRRGSNQTTEKSERIKFIIFKNKNITSSLYSDSPLKRLFFEKEIVILSSSGELLTTNKRPDFTAGVLKSACQVKKTQIDIIIKSDEEEIPVDLNLKLKENLLTFLTQDFPNQSYSCPDFISQLFDKYKPEKTSVLEPEEWNVKQEPSIGSAIMLLNTSVEAQHFALCLQKDLFLSLFGIKGLLMATNLDTLKRVYNSPNVVALIPK